MYLRRLDRKFPVYPSKEQIAVDPENYILVEGTEDIFDSKTHRLGSWTQPTKEQLFDGEGNATGFKWTANRAAVPLSAEEITENVKEQWQDVRMIRDKYLKDTDIQIIMKLETLLTSVADKKLVNYRKSLRDITDPAKNGGVSDPEKIKVAKFK